MPSCTGGSSQALELNFGCQKHHVTGPWRVFVVPGSKFRNHQVPWQLQGQRYQRVACTQKTSKYQEPGRRESEG